MRHFLKLFVFIAACACLPAFSQVAPRFKNFYPNVSNYLDVTAGTTSTGPSAAYANPCATAGSADSMVFSVQMVLVGGTSATGQVEGSINGTDWFSLQNPAFSLSTNGTAGVSFQCSWRYLRFNTLTNVGGGKVVALLSW